MNRPPLEIDGRPAPADGTLLSRCRALGIDVPAFCHGERLSTGGVCRACLVERDGRLVAACTTPAAEGGRVVTDSPRLAAYRRDLGELMRGEASPAGDVAARLERWGVTGERYPATAPARPVDASHPYLRVDLTRCIHCRKCLRACEEIQGSFVWAFEGRGAATHLAWGSERFAESDCVSCGACVGECPSGALSSIDREADPCDRATPAGAAAVDARNRHRVVRTTCGFCGVGCQLDAHVEHDRIVRIEGAESPVNHGHLCLKGRFAHRYVTHPDRLTRPLLRKAGALVPVGWDEAIAHVASELERLRGHVAGLSSSRATNEENYLFQKWLRGGLGTNDVDCCARVCHAPSATGMRESLGMGAATNSLADLEESDLLVVLGANVTEAHPVTGARLVQAVLRGAGLVVVDPRRTELAALADVHLAPRPGTNVPLLNSLASVLVETGAIDREFVATRTEGWEGFAAFVRDRSPERSAAITGVPPHAVRAAAERLAAARRPMFLHGLGVTEHLQGSEAVTLICNLALLLGAIGRPGVGVNPLRGQNNVQGAADMGCQPDLLAGYAPVSDPSVRTRFAELWGRPLPSRPGRTLPAIWDAIRSGDVRALLLFGEDVAQTDPEAAKVRAALASLELLVVQELFLTETARLAHVVLPAAGVFEKDGTFTNGERRIQRVRRVVPPPGEARPDWQILCDLMRATGWPQPYGHPSEIMDEIARVIPAFAGVSYERLEGDGLQWPVPAVGHPGTPRLHVDRFPRGTARFTCVDYVASPEAGSPLTLITGRRLEHYNSGTFTRRTANVTLADADALDMHPADAEARELREGDVARVTSRHGEVRLRIRRDDRLPRGTVFTTFHFPESRTNDLIGPTRDRRCDTPEYKVTAVEVSRA